MILRCTIDHLLLPAEIRNGQVIAFDGEEGFFMEKVEATYYEILAATAQELTMLQRAQYRLLQRGEDFQLIDELITAV